MVVRETPPPGGERRERERETVSDHVVDGGDQKGPGRGKGRKMTKEAGGRHMQICF